MTTALSIGNKKLLINIGHDMSVMAAYFPLVGMYNHIGQPSTISFREDNRYLEFEHSPAYDSDRFVGNSYSTGADLNINWIDEVSNLPHCVLRRKLIIINTANFSRKIELVAVNQFALNESQTRNSVYFDGARLVSYRDGISISCYFEDFNGSFGCADPSDNNGHGIFTPLLNRNPVSTGKIVSGLSQHLAINANSRATATLVFEFANATVQNNEKVDFTAAKYPANIDKLMQISPHIIDIHQNVNGSVIASSDSSLMLAGGHDDYNYFWTRDGAYAAMSMLANGNAKFGLKFLEACEQACSAEGYFGHRYWANLSGIGSSWHPRDTNILPLQLDATAVTLTALARLCNSGERYVAEKYWHSFGRRCAQFLLNYRYKEGLYAEIPRDCYDIWETEIGIHTYTLACLYQAFTELTKLKFIDDQLRDQMFLAANQIISFFTKELTVDGQIVRAITHGQKRFEADSSLLLLWKAGIIDAGDPIYTNTVEKIYKVLWVNSDIGGLARKENDHYLRQNSSYHGNPWVICTLWLAEYYKKINNSRADDCLNWVRSHADQSGLLAEQIHPDTGFSVGMKPLVWSHASYLSALN